MKNVMCCQCENIRELTDEERIGLQSEDYRCTADGTSKTKYDADAIRDCYRYKKQENGPKVHISPLGEKIFQCQRCANLTKINYRQSQSTHHENWECPQIGCSMQYEDTVAHRYCPVFFPGTPKNKAEQKY